MSLSNDKAELGAALLAAAFGVKAGEVQEVDGLSDFLARVKLTQYAAEAAAWCASQGAACIDEVLECWEDFATDLGLRPLERKRIEKYVTESSELANQTSIDSCADQVAELLALDSTVAISDAVEPSSEVSLRSLGPAEEPERYSILEEIGSGATARVFRCRRTEDKKVFAAKSISLAKLRRSPNFSQIYEMLHQEIAILFSLHHPRVVCLFDVVEEPDTLSLVLELEEGGSLEDYILAKDGIPEQEASSLFYQIAEGLQYIHSKGVVHQDLKPDNVLLVSKEVLDGACPQVKLTDFGHSKIEGDWYDAMPSRVGTPLYSAPEVADPQQRSDSSVDLWSLGVVLYVMLLGTCPFTGSGCELEWKIQEGKISFWRDDDRPPPSKEAQTLVKALLRIDPKKRLALEWCLAHPFVAGASGLLRRLLSIGQSGGDAVDDRYQLPPRPDEAKVRLLRQDLQRWMVKFRCSAMMKGAEIIATYGDEDSVDWERVDTASTELSQIMHFHVGAKRPSGGTAPEHLTRYRRARKTKPHENGTETVTKSVEQVSKAVEHKAGLRISIEPKLAAQSPIARRVSPETADEAAARQKRMEARKEKAQLQQHGRDGESSLAPPSDDAQSRLEDYKRKARIQQPCLPVAAFSTNAVIEVETPPNVEAVVVEDEAAARQRRMEARKQKAVGGDGPRWNFGGKSPGGQQVNDRVREHESMLDQQRRLAYRSRGDVEERAAKLK